MDDQVLGVAIVGCGAVSRNHGKAIKNSGKAELLYAMDIEREAADRFSSLYGGVSTTDYDAVLADERVRVVHIVTPHFTHPALVIKALESGKDVFCEKPLAIHVSDGRRMIAAAEKCGHKLGVCFQNRLNDASVAAKKILDAGQYGRILSSAALVRWDRHGDYYAKSPWRGRYATEGGGCIINQSIHTIDLLQYLCGRVSSLSAIDCHLRPSFEYEVEDSVMANFTFDSGATATGYFTNCATGFKTAEVEIVCERARIKVEQKGLSIDADTGEHQFIPSEVATGEKSEWGLSHGRMIEAFYDSVINGTKEPVTAQEALEAVKIIAAIQYAKGHSVVLEKD